MNTQKTIVVMGLLDRHSLAWKTGRTIESSGYRVIYTIQSEILKKRYLDTDKTLSASDIARMEILFCDVTREEEVKSVFDKCGTIDGVVHSVAYANPSTCLGPEFHAGVTEDILKSFHASSLSLATVAKYAAPQMKNGGSIVTMTFDSSRAYPLYNWMGVNKAALEAVVRALARRHGREKIRVNAVSAGPVKTTASSRIPDFDRLIDWWKSSAPLEWDPETSGESVAETVLFLLEERSRLITGQTIYVDGGASAIGGELLDFERK